MKRFLVMLVLLILAFVLIVVLRIVIFPSWEKKIRIGEITDLSKKEYFYDNILPKNLSGWWLNIRPEKVDEKLWNTAIKVEVTNKGNFDLEVLKRDGTIRIKPNVQTMIYDGPYDDIIYAGRTIRFFSSEENVSVHINIYFENAVELNGPISIYALQSDSI